MDEEEDIEPIKPKKTTALAKQPTIEEIENSKESLSLEDQLRKTGISELLISKMKRLVYYTSKVGLGLEDACKLTDVDINDFKIIIEHNDVVRYILEKKELEYKKDLLYTLSTKARSGDDKLAQWLLERRFPEFSNKKNAKQDEDSDLLAMAVSFIQKSGDSKPLINETSGQAIVISSSGDGKNWKEKFQSLLK